MNLSFREKSLWVDLIVTLGIAAYYAINLAEFSTENLADIHRVMDLLWDVVVLCIAVSIVSGIVLSAHDKKSAEAPLDEREQIAELKATRYGYWVLQIAITAVVVLYAIDMGFIPKNAGGAVPTPRYILPFAAMHIIVASYVLAELVVSSAQLWGLRREL